MQTTMKRAIEARSRKYGESSNMALQFPPIHALFDFEGTTYRAEWEGWYWDCYQGGKWNVTIHAGGYRNAGTFIGGTGIIEGTVQVPSHMIWDSRGKYLDINTRWCEAAAAAIRAKAGPNHVLNGGQSAPKGLDVIQQEQPAGIPFQVLDEKKCYGYAHSAGKTLREQNRDLSPEQVQEYLVGVPFIPESAERFRDGFLNGFYGESIPDFPFVVHGG